MPKAHNASGVETTGTKGASEIDELRVQFLDAIGVEWELPSDLRKEAESFITGVSGSLKDRAARRRALFPIIARKFKLNRNAIQNLWDEAARHRHFFGPVAKASVTAMFDENDYAEFQKWFEENGLPCSLHQTFEPLSETAILTALHEQLVDATVNRSDARKGVQDERREAILRSLFGTWLYEIAGIKNARAYFTGLPKERVPDSYFKLLSRDYTQVLDRRCGGIVMRVPKAWWGKHTKRAIGEVVATVVSEAYTDLSNHSYCGILFEFPDGNVNSGDIWELIGDITLFSERHRSTELRAGFFRPLEIEAQTIDHIRALEQGEGTFGQYNFGFSFKDCIVNCERELDVDGANANVESVFLLLEKHEADETKIPCPACWSLDIRGNSYPIFGVRSWECQNPLCPERSAFDRGNRFSAMSILRSEAASDERALIDEDSLRNWKLDVVASRTNKDFLEMFVRHFSLPNDVVRCINLEGAKERIYGRRAEIYDREPALRPKATTLTSFEQCSFFARYLNVASDYRPAPLNRVKGTPRWLKLFQGSCISVLQQIEEESIDGAVTSPPYYNARDYSMWANLYTYLYDMKMAAEGVFRVLKPGGYYLFNIFDYFDNDNILAFSALGKRRLPLGAYMIQIFRRSGFKIEGNIAWHKGEIEGKRNYNQGNRAPFFQLPLNSWEHVLVLRKPGVESNGINFPSAIYRRPVFKWVNGENRHGHSAPFPQCIPDLLCRNLDPGSTILDPFGGSLTTALAARRCGQNAVAVELHESYCQLGLRRILEEENMLPLFRDGSAP